MYAAPAGQRTRLFTAFGVPVYASGGALLLLAILLLFYGSGGPERMVGALVIAVVAFGSIIAHELGHAFAIRKLGYGNSTIVLGALGGVCEWRARPNRWDSIKISLAGPAVSLALAGLGFALTVLLAPVLQGSYMLRTLVFSLAVLNLLWGVFNLIPIFPMDGGRALRTYLGTRMPERRAIRISLITSGVCAALLMLLGAAFGEFFVLLLLGWMMLQNWREWTRHFS